MYGLSLWKGWTETIIKYFLQNILIKLNIEKSTSTPSISISSISIFYLFYSVVWNLHGTDEKAGDNEYWRQWKGCSAETVYFASFYAITLFYEFSKHDNSFIDYFMANFPIRYVLQFKIKKVNIQIYFKCFFQYSMTKLTSFQITDRKQS